MFSLSFETGDSILIIFMMLRRIKVIIRIIFCRYGMEERDKDGGEDMNCLGTRVRLQLHPMVCVAVEHLVFVVSHLVLFF